MTVEKTAEKAAEKAGEKLLDKGPMKLAELKAKSPAELLSLSRSRSRTPPPCASRT
jgi:hypothetical protein